MDPDNFQQAWQAQASPSQMTINVDLVLQEVRRNQQTFAAIILRRDIIEIGVGILLIPVWFYMGSKLSLPWTWYLEVPALVFTVGFMLADRLRHKRQPPEPGQPLRQCVADSLAQVEHQIWLLRNIFWWYILPSALAMLAFFAQVAWMIALRRLENCRGHGPGCGHIGEHLGFRVLAQPEGRPHRTRTATPGAPVAAHEPAR